MSARAWAAACLLAAGGCSSAQRGAAAPQTLDLSACLYTSQMALIGGDFVSRKKFANADRVPLFRAVRNVDEKTDVNGCDVLVELTIGSAVVIPGVSNKAALVYSAHGDLRWPLFKVEATAPDLLPGTDATPVKLARRVREAFKPGSPLYGRLAQMRAARQKAVEAAAREPEPDALAVAAEAAGDSALAAGSAQDAMNRYASALGETAGLPEARRRLFGKAAAAASKLPELPEVPEEARRRLIRGKAKLAAAATDGFGPVVEELEQAVILAPWSPEAHYNLALAFEGASRYEDAIAALKNFRLLAPSSPEAAAAQDKIYELEVAAEGAARIRGLAGRWVSQHGTVFSLTMRGESLHAAASPPPEKEQIHFHGNENRFVSSRKGRVLARDIGLVIDGALSGAVFAGEVALPPYRPSTCPGNAYTCFKCLVGAETSKATGRLEAGAITITFHRSRYEVNSREVDWFSGREECTGVRLLDKASETLTLTRK